MNFLNLVSMLEVYFIKEMQAFEYVTFTELKIEQAI
jgi:hypothetical protein